MAKLVVHNTLIPPVSLVTFTSDIRLLQIYVGMRHSFCKYESFIWFIYNQLKSPSYGLLRELLQMTDWAAGPKLNGTNLFPESQCAPFTAYNQLACT